MRHILTTLVGLVALTACSQAKDIDVKDLPPVVLESALKAVPGFIVEEAELEKENGVLVYELEGKSTKDGFEYEIEISPEGEILEIEKGDEEEDDDEE
ncbi:hypothetical protein VDG1235_1656 [Verrucomicrobiia bacterium DG1235]|nr:hypothetical protein VDG1235_1656 [Verrucomicrobiae bacterium DG1235]